MSKFVGQNQYSELTLRERFWQKVEKRGPDECWEWLAYKSPRGYGYFGISGKTEKAHRVCFSLSYGSIPEGIYVLHHCDNPGCVNPSHLFLGTHADNMADMKNKGRHHYCKGEAHPESKLTNGKVMWIREMLNMGIYQRVIGDFFGVTRSTISLISRGKKWTHI